MMKNKIGENRNKENSLLGANPPPKGRGIYAPRHSANFRINSRGFILSLKAEGIRPLVNKNIIQDIYAKNRRKEIQSLCA